MTRSVFVARFGRIQFPSACIYDFICYSNFFDRFSLFETFFISRAFQFTKEKNPRHNCVNVFGVLCSFTWLCTFKIEWKSWHSQFKLSAWFRMKCDWNLDTQRFLTLLCICKDKLNYLMEVWRWEYISMELFGLLSLWMEYNGHSCVCSCLCFLSILLFFQLYSVPILWLHIIDWSWGSRTIFRLVYQNVCVLCSFHFLMISIELIVLFDKTNSKHTRTIE